MCVKGFYVYALLTTSSTRIKPLLLCTARFETWLQVPPEAIDIKTCVPMRPRGVDNTVIGVANMLNLKGMPTAATYYRVYLILDTDCPTILVCPVGIFLTKMGHIDMKHPLHSKH